MDERLFFIINRDLTSRALDAVMPFITDFSNFYILIFLAAAVIIVKDRSEGVRTVVLLIAVVVAGDFFANTLKGVFMRIRPCNALEGVRLLAGCSGSYSFPSGHATNIFSSMVFLSLRYDRRLAPAFLAVAAAVAYSRVYVGVHYPLDVAGGALLGTSSAFFFTEADRRWVGRVLGRLRGGAPPAQDFVENSGDK